MGDLLCTHRPLVTDPAKLSEKEISEILLVYCKRVVLFLINVHVTVLEFGLIELLCIALEFGYVLTCVLELFTCC